jgi:hypothetical protein
MGWCWSNLRYLCSPFCRPLFGLLSLFVTIVMSLLWYTPSGYPFDIFKLFLLLWFQFFVLDVVNNFTRLSEDDLYTQLNRIYKMADENGHKADHIGILTAAYRDQWSNARAKLMEGNTFLYMKQCLLLCKIVNGGLNSKANVRYELV